MPDVRRRFVMVDGLRTHYLEAGDGDDTIVLLHGGAFGEDAALSWERNIPALAERYRVVAPDWLGFGRTDKVRDFVSGTQRMLTHMTRFLEVLCIDDAAFGGLSMGATLLLRVTAESPERWPARAIFTASGGGFVPANDARQALVDYDQTLDGMRRLVEVSHGDPSFALDDAYVERRWRSSLEPGAWEATASARFKSPTASPRSEFGNADTIPYERIRVPTLLTAGGRDRLRAPGYVDEVAARIPDARAVTFAEAGHVLNVEEPERWNRVVLDFLASTSTPMHPDRLKGEPS